MSAVKELEQRSKETEEAFARLERKAVERSSHGSEDNEELRSFLRGERPVYDVQPEGPVNFRDLVKGTAAAGGNLVPKTFYNRIVEYMAEASGLLQTNPTVINTTNGTEIEVPVVTDAGDVAVVPEAQAIPEDDPTFSKVTLGAVKYGKLIEVSRELVEDSAVNLEEFLARTSGRQLGNKFGAAVVANIVTGATLGATAKEDTGFGNQATANEGFDSLIDLFYSVASPYRNSSSAGWLLNDQTAAAVRKFKNSEGNYVWQPAVLAGQPDQLLGKPVYVDPNVAGIAASAKTILFGDFSAVFVRMVGGVRFERSDHYRFGNDIVTFRALLRGDGKLTDPNAIKYLAMAAS